MEAIELDMQRTAAQKGGTAIAVASVTVAPLFEGEKKGSGSRSP